MRTPFTIAAYASWCALLIVWLPGYFLRKRSSRIPNLARQIPTTALLVLGFVMIAFGHELVGALVIVMTRGMFNTLIPVLVIERSNGGVLSSQASYSTWRDFGAAVGPLTAPWLFLNVPQTPLYAALAAVMGVSAYFCLVRR